MGGSLIFVTVAALLFWAMNRPGSQAFYLTPTEIVAMGWDAFLREFGLPVGIQRTARVVGVQ